MTGFPIADHELLNRSNRQREAPLLYLRGWILDAVASAFYPCSSVVTSSNRLCTG